MGRKAGNQKGNNKNKKGKKSKEERQKLRENRKKNRSRKNGGKKTQNKKFAVPLNKSVSHHDIVEVKEYVKRKTGPLESFIKCNFSGDSFMNFDIERKERSDFSCMSRYPTF